MDINKDKNDKKDYEYFARVLTEYSKKLESDKRYKAICINLNLLTDILIKSNSSSEYEEKINSDDNDNPQSNSNIITELLNDDIDSEDSDLVEYRKRKAFYQSHVQSPNPTLNYSMTNFTLEKYTEHSDELLSNSSTNDFIDYDSDNLENSKKIQNLEYTSEHVSKYVSEHTSEYTSEYYNSEYNSEYFSPEMQIPETQNTEIDRSETPTQEIYIPEIDDPEIDNPEPKMLIYLADMNSDKKITESSYNIINLNINIIAFDNVCNIVFGSAYSDYIYTQQQNKIKTFLPSTYFMFNNTNNLYIYKYKYIYGYDFKIYEISKKGVFPYIKNLVHQKWTYKSSIEILNSNYNLHLISYKLLPNEAKEQIRSVSNIKNYEQYKFVVNDKNNKLFEYKYMFLISNPNKKRLFAKIEDNMIYIKTFSFADKIFKFDWNLIE